MELNREQAIEILEKFYFFQGQREGRELWNYKPFDLQEQDIANFSRDVYMLIKYIKELTEEVADLRAIAEQYQKQFEDAKADTVREMQKKLKEKLEHYPQRCGDCFKEKVDQIAKEMLEG